MIKTFILLLLEKKAALAGRFPLPRSLPSLNPCFLESTHSQSQHWHPYLSMYVSVYKLASCVEVFFLSLLEEGLCRLVAAGVSGSASGLSPKIGSRYT